MLRILLTLRVLCAPAEFAAVRKRAPGWFSELASMLTMAPAAAAARAPVPSGGERRSYSRLCPARHSMHVGGGAALQLLNHSPASLHPSAVLCAACCCRPCRYSDQSPGAPASVGCASSRAVATPGGPTTPRSAYGGSVLGASSPMPSRQASVAQPPQGKGQQDAVAPDVGLLLETWAGGRL